MINQDMPRESYSDLIPQSNSCEHAFDFQHISGGRAGWGIDRAVREI